MDLENRDSSITAHLRQMRQNLSWTSAFAILMSSCKEDTD
jgi:hypothetical protein